MGPLGTWGLSSFPGLLQSPGGSDSVWPRTLCGLPGASVHRRRTLVKWVEGGRGRPHQQHRLPGDPAGGRCHGNSYCQMCLSRLQRDILRIYLRINKIMMVSLTSLLPAWPPPSLGPPGLSCTHCLPTLPSLPHLSVSCDLSSLLPLCVSPPLPKSPLPAALFLGHRWPCPGTGSVLVLNPGCPRPVQLTLIISDLASPDSDRALAPTHSRHTTAPTLTGGCRAWVGGALCWLRLGLFSSHFCFSFFFFLVNISSPPSYPQI